MASTPPPRAARAHTPPTPLHGPRYDSYEPYSPRRSKRSTAHSNPYSSFSSTRSPAADCAHDSTPPPTIKKPRFTRAPTHLSSPPSSPVSPVRQTIHKTPRKVLPSLAPPTIDPANMLPTPSKTPSKKRPAVHTAARILNFQPSHPNDAMPTPRRIKKHTQQQSLNGFELYDEELETKSSNIEIFTDTNARVPVMDDTEDNPFIGSKFVPRRRSTRKSKAEIEHDAQMEEAVKNEEGVVYVFRGKKILRRFVDPEQEEPGSSHESDLGNTAEQRSLKRKAGTAAERPLTRSSVKPRLLFPVAEREAHDDDVDEEALTDIEIPAKGKKRSPFDMWQRTKGIKRPGDTVDGTAKRTRRGDGAP